MTKLNRLTAKVFGETADATGNNPEIGQFGSGKAGTYMGTSDVATIQGLPAWSNGWIDSVTPTQQFPPLPEMTGVHKVLSYQEAYLLQNGVAEWDASTDYYTEQFCRVGNALYYSLTDNNVGNNPTISTANWKLYNGDNLFKNQTSNCILEMPSTAPSYSGLTITIPAGLKVLIPNGRNADGTLNNIEYTTTSTATYTITQPTYSNRWLLFINSSGTLSIVSNTNIGDSNYGVFYFDYVRNTWRYNNGGTWQDQTICCIGIITNNSTAITSVSYFNGLRLLNYNDKTSITSWTFPVQYGTALTFSYTSGTKYYAPQSGYFVAGATLNAAGASFNIYLGDNLPLMNSRADGNFGVIVSAPCRSGDYITLTWAAGSGVTPVSGTGYIYFVPTWGGANLNA